MNFDFSDEQKLLREQARKFLTAHCPLAGVRASHDAVPGVDATLWRAIAALGWLGSTIPECYGGAGLGRLELCVLAEEFGRVLAPLPFSSTAYLFTEALLLAGSEAQRRELLPRVAAGEAIGTLARSEGPGPLHPARVATTFRDGRLSGTKTPVADGLCADHAVVLARSGEAPGTFSLVLVDLRDTRVRRRALTALDASRPPAEITFHEAPATVLGPPGGGWALLARLLDRAAVLLAFEQLGGADACLAMARDYALTRRAFGRVIGSYQAIKHKLADVYVKNELARSNAWYGAWALASEAPELPLAAAAARVAATQAFDFAAKENIQVHGGIGFTWEADPHLFYKRARLLALTLDAQGEWKQKLVARLEHLEAGSVDTRAGAPPRTEA